MSLNNHLHVKKGDTVVVLSSNKTIPTSSTDSLNIRIL